MKVFDRCTVLLDLKTLPYKEKQRLRTVVAEHGGRTCPLVNRQVMTLSHDTRRCSQVVIL